MKNNIIKASEEVFPIDKEMSLDEQSDQILRQIGFKFGANWAIEKACEWLESAMLIDDIYGVGNNVENLKELINDLKKAMEGGEG